MKFEVETKMFRAADIFTFPEFKQMADIVRLSELDGKPAAPEIVEKVVKPALDRIQAKVGAAIDPMYLALAAEEAIRHFLIEGKTDVFATTVPATAFPSGPVN